MSILDIDKILDGTISTAGKVSAEKYNIINKKYKVKENKKNKLYDDFFIPDLDWEDEDDNSKEIEKIFSYEDFRNAQASIQKTKIEKNIKNYFKNHIKKNIIKQKNKFLKMNNSYYFDKTLNNTTFTPKKGILKLKKNFKFPKNNYYHKNGLASPLKKHKYKYHYNHHMNILENDKYKQYNYGNKEPIYYPNVDYLYNKIKIGPNWKKMTGRKNSLFKESGHSLDKYYNNSINLKFSNYSFIDMVKQTQRNGFPINHNLRQRYETKFIPIDNKKDYIKWTKICKRPLKSKSPFSRDSYDFKLKMILMRKKKTNFYTNYKPSLDKMLSIEKSKSIPDFNLCLTRKYLEKLERKKRIESNEMYYPKYNSVKERVKMMVVYNKNKKQNNKFEGIKSNEFFNLVNSFEQIYGHKLQVVPKFEKMVPRPSDKNLPSFMKKMFNRMSSYYITDKTLKLNNYSNGDMHYDIYKRSNQTTPKIKKQEYSLFEKELNLSNFNDEEDDEKNNKIDEKNINKNNMEGNKIKKEINNIIKKMNNLYYEYRNKNKK